MKCGVHDTFTPWRMHGTRARLGAYMTHYTTLGVAAKASADDIKRAYRKLAMKHHPDRHPPGVGQRRAEAQFKLVQEAYDVLGDAPKRARYDEELSWGAFSSASAYTSAYQRRPVSTEHLNVYTHASISAKDWYEGCWMDIKLPVPYSVICLQCMGRAKVWCRECLNAGRLMRFKVRVYIPARTNYGQLMVVPDSGARDEYGNHGKLFLQLRVVGFEHFRLNGSNLHTTVEVPPAILRFGGEWDVPVLEGRLLRVKIPPRMKHRGKLRLAGYGVLHNDRDRGDMFVEVERWQPVTFGQAVRSWALHGRLGLRSLVAPFFAWWGREVAT